MEHTCTCMHDIQSLTLQPHSQASRKKSGGGGGGGGGKERKKREVGEGRGRDTLKGGGG